MDLSTISTLLSELLSENKSVTLPTMGCFVLEENSSELQFSGKIISPPEKKILFCTSEFEDDGVLVAAFAKKMGVSANEAKDEVFSILKFISDELASVGKVLIPSLGTITMGAGDTLYFHASSDCMLCGSFPFEPISVMPIDKSVIEEMVEPETKVVEEIAIKEEPAEETPKNRNKTLWIVLIAIMVLIIVLLALIYIFREELRPMLEQFLYTQEDMSILKKASEL